ncbi:RNA-binding domain-containing protein [Coemansia reversa NRRL 1564]|uniref:RNA-binding domain-containing protein n=1 Tax=Coemansia reversa (strain ATCC 12441 / NRRL 1564) TaxID=763665 RepID=A0A2G5BE81_COERN|nr:RNA-binding domain-containing protein [Coemansia reversa NRRL 1564]|eukprot:PIA17314.1 RNA-binding domain-containing protein [Coemansia reversa NRRL 1564]
MSLSTRIDQSLDQIIRETRKQKQPQKKAKKAAAVNMGKSTTAAPSAKRRSKNRTGTGANSSRVPDALAARLGRGATTGKALGKGPLAGRVGKTKSDGKGSSGRLAGLAERRKASLSSAGAESSKKREKTRMNISIKGEAGPAAIFISNLDPEASTEDVKTCFKQFGSIRDCTLLYDSNGKASGHAQVTFTVKPAAEEAVAKLNNALADGRRLSVNLMPPGKSAIPAQNMAPFVAPQSYGSARRGGKKPRRSGGGSRMDVD